MRLNVLISYLTISSSIQFASAGGNDWISPAFVLKKSGATNAQRTINSYAKSSAKKGPWTVYGGDGSTLPPDGDKRDYLSWAPYHWPDCNWCQSGRAHLSTGGNRTSSDGIADNSTQIVPADDGGDFNYGDDDDSDSDELGDPNGDDDGDSEEETVPIPDLPISTPLSLRKMVKRTALFSAIQDRRDVDQIPLETSEIAAQTSPSPLPTELTDVESSGSDPEDEGDFDDGETGVENARKTSKKTTKSKSTHKAAATRTKSGGDCTPSPTKSLAPSATWTTCKYVVRDGKVNPDVRQLQGVQAIADASQSIIYNAIASVLSGTTSYAQEAAKSINTFFLDAQTGMHPRIPYGQVIRGPQTQTGQYLGVLDLRGMVKVSNAVMIMQSANSAAWTSSLASAMETWVKQYVNWLETSAIGKKAIAAPNNHGTFAANQLAAMHVLAGDKAAAESALKSYFSGQFQDQIAASGEQPFEAVRTRPFHYRCFNLEAMITNAKLGEELGLDFWTAKSKYGTTIKDALDFVMKKGPGKESVSDIFPHIATVAAVYGDPGGKYMAYLKKKDSHYMTAPYYYYDQAAALGEASTAGKVETEVEEILQDPGVEDTFEAIDEDGLPEATPEIPWECPAAFATALRVQLDDGIFVTCDELKPLYGYTDGI